MKELLSPAGDMESLKAAIHGGADAIYVGMKEFGARKFAHNFDREEIKEAVLLCHLYGVRLYITMNTVVKDQEVESFLELVYFLYHIGVDALIMQDFGMIHLVLEMYPDLEIHASTQFNNSSLETIKLLKDMGVKRVVLARELSLEEIRKIDIDIEKEVFIHGALCIGYSGNCLFSSMLGNRSGNRGECTGSCRLPYELYDGKELLKSGYLLSTKELNTSSRFQELLDSNIQSFKIEGRMKSPEYVYFITKFYRNIMDGKGYQEEDLDTLKILFNREFTTGNLFSDFIMNPKSPNHLGLKVGKVLKIEKDRIKIQLDRSLHQEDGIRFFPSKKGMMVNFLYDENFLLTSSQEKVCYVKNSIGLTTLDDVYLTSSKWLKEALLNYEKKKIPIQLSFYGKVSEKARLIVCDGIHTVTVSGKVCDRAQKQAVSKERIIQQLSKLGETVYSPRQIEIDISDDLFIPMSTLNEMRRDAIEKLNSLRCSFERKGKQEVFFPKLDVSSTAQDSFIVDTLEELLKKQSAFRLYLTNFSLFLKYQKNKNIYYIEPRNTFRSKIHERSLVGEYRYPIDTISDYSFNVTNIYSVYYLLRLGYSCVTLSVELTEVEIISLIEKFYQKFLFYPNVEVVCLDRIELMIIKGNILNLSIHKEYSLIDLKKRKFPVFFDGVYTHILNHEIMNRNIKIACNKRYHYKYLK